MFADQQLYHITDRKTYSDLLYTKFVSKHKNLLTRSRKL